MAVSKNDLDIRLQWPLDMKIEYAVQVLLEFYLHYKGQVYLTFSGGKDSQVVLEIIRKMFNGEYKKYFKDLPYEYGYTEDNCLNYSVIPAVWAFHDKYNLTFASCYYDSEVQYKGAAVHVEGSRREGCMFCLFGIEQEEQQKRAGKLQLNRFEKLAITHPKQHKYLINTLGFDKVCDAINVSHTPSINEINKPYHPDLFNHKGENT